MKRALLAFVAAIVLAVGFAPAPAAQADAGSANICLYITSRYIGDTADGITVWFDKTVTGTPIPVRFRNEIMRGECSKTKYPTLVPSKWITPGYTSASTRTRCESQWGGFYYSSKVYGVSLINGKLSLYCKRQYKNSSGTWT